MQQQIGWIDARDGVTGEMWLGALVDAGASLQAMERGVQTLGVGEVRVAYAPVRRGDRQAVTVRVRPPAQTPGVATIAQVRALLEFAALDPEVRELAVTIFDRLADAEATTFDAHVDDVRFHEVAMLDDLAVIVGAAIGLSELDVAEWTAGPVGVTAPEVLDPVAASLLRDQETVLLDTHERVVTPVGAAILTVLARPAPEPPAMVVTAEGAGAAARDLGDAGLLHLAVGTPVEASGRAPVAQPDRI